LLAHLRMLGDDNFLAHVPVTSFPMWRN